MFSGVLSISRTFLVSVGLCLWVASKTVGQVPESGTVQEPGEIPAPAKVQATQTDTSTERPAYSPSPSPSPSLSPSPDEFSSSQIIATDSRALSMFAQDLQVAPQSSGLIIWMDINEGDLISQDQTLAQLDKRNRLLEVELADLQLTLAKERADNDVEIKFAKESIDIANKGLERARMATQGRSSAMSEAEIDQLRFDKVRAQLSHQQALRTKIVSQMEAKIAESQKEVSTVNLSLHEIQSPIDGVVIEIFKRRGEYLQVGQPIMRIVKNDVMRISAAVALSQAGQINRQCTVRFTPRWEAQTTFPVYEGKIVFVSAEAFGEVDTVQILAEVQNPDRSLRAKVTGELSIFAAPPVRPAN